VVEYWWIFFLRVIYIPRGGVRWHKKRQDKKISQWTLYLCERQELFVFIAEIRG